MSMRRVILASLIPVVAMMSLACTIFGPGVGPASSKTVRVDDSYNGQTIDVPQGGSLVVSLESNPSTGYRWEVTDISDRQVLGEVGREFKPGKAPPDMVGVPGRDVWTFKALGQGTARLRLGYIPPGRVSEDAAKTFDLQINVK